jgi:hypothetical protein
MNPINVNEGIVYSMKLGLNGGALIIQNIVMVLKTYSILGIRLSINV